MKISSLMIRPLKNMYNNPSSVGYVHKKYIHIACIIMVSILFFMPYNAVAKDKVIAKVAQEEIYQHELDTLYEMFAVELANLAPEQRDTFLYNFMIEQKLFAKAAKDKKIDQTDDYKKIKSLYEVRALRDMYYKLHVLPNITEENLKAFYDKKAAEVKKESEIRASHILVKTEELANKVSALLQDGADFAKMAEEYSEGPSKTNGGDLGYFGKGSMVPEFEKVAFALEVNAISEPVKTQFGWHLIKLTDMRSKQVPGFESVKENIREVLLKDELQNVTNQLKKKYIIEDLR